MIATFLGWEPWQTKLVEDLVSFESFKSHLYDDATGKFPIKSWVGNLTIGYGWNVEGVGINSDLGLVILKYQVEQCAKELPVWFYWFDAMTPDRKRALTNLSFNLGIGRLLGFKDALRAMEHRTYEIAAKEFLDSLWAKQVGPERSKFIADLIRAG